MLIIDVHHNFLLFKFFRDMNITAKEAQDLNLMDDLQNAPTKPRSKYGPRKSLSKQEREQITRDRNREHAKATRIRKRMFKKVNDDLHINISTKYECSSI
jgi:hypothetical protein